MPDGTSRFSYKGGKRYSTIWGQVLLANTRFLPEISIAKISTKDAPLVQGFGDGVCTCQQGWVQCEIPLKLKEGATVAVFGLGAVGMAVIQGAVMNKAGLRRLLASTSTPLNFLRRQSLGATECINPKDYDKPIQERFG